MFYDSWWIISTGVGFSNIFVSNILTDIYEIIGSSGCCTTTSTFWFLIFLFAPLVASLILFIDCIYSALNWLAANWLRMACLLTSCYFFSNNFFSFFLFIIKWRIQWANETLYKITSSIWDFIEPSHQPPIDIPDSLHSKTINLPLHLHHQRSRCGKQTSAFKINRLRVLAMVSPLKKRVSVHNCMLFHENLMTSLSHVRKEVCGTQCTQDQLLDYITTSKLIPCNQLKLIGTALSFTINWGRVDLGRFGEWRWWSVGNCTQWRRWAKLSMLILYEGAGQEIRQFCHEWTNPLIVIATPFYC